MAPSTPTPALSTKEVESRGRALQKATSSAPDASAPILALLDELRGGVRASEDLLRSTRIGMTVNRLKQHKDPAVARAAGELVSKWKTDIKKMPGTPGSAAASVRSPSAASPPGAAGPVAVKTERLMSTARPEKRNSKEDGVNWRITGNLTRDGCLKLMYDGLAYMSRESIPDVLTVARSVELAAFDRYQPETSEAYKSKIRSLYQNFKSKQSGDLRQRVLNGSIKPRDLVVMSSEDLRSAERKAEDLKIEKENMNKAMVAQEEKAVSTQLQCGKCGQKKVSYTQAQTRSADEPMTTFCECLNCGNRWKFS